MLESWSPESTSLFFLSLESFDESISFYLLLFFLDELYLDELVLVELFLLVDFLVVISSDEPSKGEDV